MDVSDRHPAPNRLSLERTHLFTEHETGFAPDRGMTLRRRKESSAPSGNRTQTFNPILYSLY
jgi:hypothetical protein